MDETMAEFRVLSLSVSLNSVVEEQEVCSVQYASPLLHPSRANNNKRSRVWLKKKKETEAILVIGVGGHSNRQSRGIYASWLVCLLCLSVCLQDILLPQSPNCRMDLTWKLGQPQIKQSCRGEQRHEQRTSI